MASPITRVRRMVKQKVRERAIWSRLGPKSRARVRRAGGVAVTSRLGPKGLKYALKGRRRVKDYRKKR